MSGFIVEVMLNKEESDEDRFMVKEESTGWFLPNMTKITANHVCDKFNELLEKPLNLHIDFNEWNRRINRLDRTNRRLLKIEKIYEMESDRILKEIRENHIDIKAMYGGNNDKTRKRYVDEQLTELLEEKEELEFLKADDNRRISYLKKIITMKIEMMGNE